MNLQEARRPALVPLAKPASSVAVLSYAMTFPEDFFAAPRKPGTAPGDLEFILHDIEEAKKLAPIVVVSNHWSAELLQEPKDYQRETAHLAIERGAALVVGHHPHVLQGVEFYKTGVIFYSLGNFVFGSYSQRCRTSIIARLEFSPAGQIQKVEAIPVWVYNPEVNFQPRPLSGKEGEAVAQELREISRAFGTQVSYDPASGRITFQPPAPP